MTFDLDSVLRCPISGATLVRDGRFLISAEGQRYPVIQDVPVLLAPRESSTLWVADASLEAATKNPDGNFYEETIGISPEQLAALKPRLDAHLRSPEPIDPVISTLVAATSGYMYEQMVGSLGSIPIPSLRCPKAAKEETLLDIGCNWGRWSIAAAQSGYNVVGIDPSLGAVLAAKRLAKSLGLEHKARFVVADALQLPFAPGTFQAVFSYSVLQHFSTENAITAINQAAMASRENADLWIQMPNRFGIRSFFHLLKRGFRRPEGFDVRYYSPRMLRKMFSYYYGPSKLSVDGFFGLGIQPKDMHLMPLPKKLILQTSELLRTASMYIRPLCLAADSLYVNARCCHQKPDWPAPTITST